MFGTFVINLKDSSARLAKVSEELSRYDIDFTRIDAVDGRKSVSTDFPEYNMERSLSRHGRGLTGGEIACYLSHIKALKAFIASDNQQALILEDDASFGDHFGVQITELSSKLKNFQNWDVVNLVEKRNDWKQPAFDNGRNIVSRAYYFPMLATANLWSREGAINFLNSKFSKVISGPFDTELRSFCAIRGRGLSLENPVSHPSGLASDIDSSQITRVEANKSIKGRPIKPRLVRHFPDYTNAWFSMKFRSKFF